MCDDVLDVVVGSKCPATCHTVTGFTYVSVRRRSPFRSTPACRRSCSTRSRSPRSSRFRRLGRSGCPSGRSRRRLVFVAFDLVESCRKLAEWDQNGSRDVAQGAHELFGLTDIEQQLVFVHRGVHFIHGDRSRLRLGAGARIHAESSPSGRKSTVGSVTPALLARTVSIIHSGVGRDTLASHET